MHNENERVEEKGDIELKRKYIKKKQSRRELRSRIAGLAIILIRAMGKVNWQIGIYGKEVKASVNI